MELPHARLAVSTIVIYITVHAYAYTYNKDIFGVELNTKIIFETRWYKKNALKLIANYFGRIFLFFSDS